MDTARFLANYTNIITARQIHRIIKENLKDWLHNLVCTAAAGMEEEIKLRKVSFDPIKTSARLDGNSGKVRDIGVECIKQQIYDYVATNGLRELFERKIGTYQCPVFQEGDRFMERQQLRTGSVRIRARPE